MLTLVSPAPLAGQSRDNAVMALLTRIATRCDDIDAQVAADGALDRNQIRIDGARIREAADEARRIIVRAHQEGA